MIIDSNIVWITGLIGALFFTIEATDFPLRAAGGPVVSAGIITSYLRIIGFPFIAAIFWYVMAAFSIANNNCLSAFASCFTSPTFATVTATITTGEGSIFYLVFFGLFAIMVVYGIVTTLYFAFRPLIVGMEGDKDAM